MNSKSYLYIFFAFAALMVFSVLGFVVLAPSKVQDSGSSSSSSSLPAGGSISGSGSGSGSSSDGCQGDSCPVPSSEEKSFEGTVVKTNEAEVVEGATHLLKDEEGRIIAYLEARDDKLKMVEGMSVTVVGKVVKTLEGKALVEVEEVRFR